MLSSKDLPDPGIEPESPAAPALQADFFTTEPPGKPAVNSYFAVNTHCQSSAFCEAGT